MNKMKTGDEVIVIAGKDKGKRGTVLAMINGGKKVLIEGVNMAKKHTRANPNTGDKGGIIDKAMPIDRSNVMVYNPETQKGSRVTIRVLKDGEKVRYFSNSDQLVDVNG